MSLYSSCSARSVNVSAACSATSRSSGLRLIRPDTACRVIFRPPPTFVRICAVVARSPCAARSASAISSFVKIGFAGMGSHLDSAFNIPRHFAKAVKLLNLFKIKLYPCTRHTRRLYIHIALIYPIQPHKKTPRRFYRRPYASKLVFRL